MGAVSLYIWLYKRNVNTEKFREKFTLFVARGGVNCVSLS